MGKNIKLSRRALGLASVAIAWACSAVPALAAEAATSTISSTQLSPTAWQYNLTLNDTGTTNIGTFWFAWIPGQDYMPTSPTGIVSPTSWSAKITNAGASDGFAIQWVAGAGAALTPGQSLSFAFDSSTTPQQMAANSPFFPATPVLTSFVYGGTPFSDAGVKFDVQTAPVPEPSSIALMVGGGLLMAARIRRRSSRKG